MPGQKPPDSGPRRKQSDQNADRPVDPRAKHTDWCASQFRRPRLGARTSPDQIDAHQSPEQEERAHREQSNRLCSRVISDSNQPLTSDFDAGQRPKPSFPREKPASSFLNHSSV